MTNSGGTRHTLRPCQRLKSSPQFRSIFDGRLSVSDDTLVVFGQPRDDPHRVGRLGLSVSKKIGNAVIRNRWKRRIREAFRQQPNAVAGWDLVAIPKRGAVCDTQRIARSLPKLVERLRRKHQHKTQPHHP